jgi:hypothetical protein
LTGVLFQHVDTRYYFIRENEEDGIIKVEFIISIDNDSDITKNVRQEMFERHVKKFLGSIEIIGSACMFCHRKGIENILTFIEDLVYLFTLIH